MLNKRKRQMRGYLFLLPSLTGTGGFVLLPFLDVVRRSFLQAVGSLLWAVISSWAFTRN